MTHLTETNYSKGFLVDEELMAGVSINPEQPNTFLAFVLRHTTGEYLGYKIFLGLEEALQAVNQIPRSWIFEQAGGCGNGGNCKSGNCNQESCGIKKCGSKTCSATSQIESS